MEDNLILRPYNKLPLTQTATILLVGAEGTGKHLLAKSLLQCTYFSLQVHTAITLPLPVDNDGARPRIDFIVFMVDLKNRESMRVVEESLQYVDCRYFLGKSCFVVLDVKCPERHGVSLEVITEMSDRYSTPALYGSVSTNSEEAVLAKQILNLTEVSAGLRHNISPLLLESTKVPCDFQSL